MHRIDSAGWLSPVRYSPSPNFNQRPVGCTIDLLVIHNISLPAGQFGTGHIEALFSNCLDCSADASFSDLAELRVSAHLLIERDGSIVQFVSLFDRAWHAGISCFRERENCNDFSIGIELEGTDLLPYTDAQYGALTAVTNMLLAYFPTLNADAIVGHSDIAPGRKSDPGPAFDWTRYRRSLNRQATSFTHQNSSIKQE